MTRPRTFISVSTEKTSRGADRSTAPCTGDRTGAGRASFGASGSETKTRPRHGARTTKPRAISSSRPSSLGVSSAGLLPLVLRSLLVSWGSVTSIFTNLTGPAGMRNAASGLLPVQHQPSEHRTNSCGSPYFLTQSRLDPSDMDAIKSQARTPTSSLCHLPATTWQWAFPDVRPGARGIAALPIPTQSCDTLRSAVPWPDAGARPVTILTLFKLLRYNPATARVQGGCCRCAVDRSGLNG